MNPATPVIKVCGIKDPNIAYKTAKLGVSHIGIICHDGSKRYVNSQLAKVVVKSIINGGAEPVAVCVNHTAKEMIQLCRDLNINVVQLHGGIARHQHQHLPAHITRIYVLHVDQSGNVVNKNDETIKQLNLNRDYILFDGLVGGSGKCIVTNDIHDAAGGFRYFVAGGLASRNVSHVIDKCHPYGVDVSSSVEDHRGDKKLASIKDFIAAVNQGGNSV